MDRKKAKELWPIIKAYAEGHAIKMRREDSVPLIDPRFDANPMDYEIVPKPKPVDLSALIESGIDCEFSHNKIFTDASIHKLKEVTHNQYPYVSRSGSYIHCRPRMNHIHYYEGGKCPLPKGFKVRVICETGKFEIDSFSKDINWDCTANRVRGFEVIGLSEGYCWPWELEK